MGGPLGARWRQTLSAAEVAYERGDRALGDSRQLAAGDRFWRRLERRLPLVRGGADERLPAAPAGLEVVARRPGCRQPRDPRAGEPLLAGYRGKTASIRETFDPALERASEEQRRMTDSLLVLLACREPSFRDQLGQTLVERQLQVVAVGTPHEVIVTLETREVAAMVIYDDLPLSDAEELAQAVRRHQLGIDVPLVLLVRRPWSAPRKAVAIQELALVDVLPIEDVTPEQVCEMLVAELQGPTHDPDAPPSTSFERLADPASHAERRQVEVAAEAAKQGQPLLRGNLRAEPFPELLHKLYREQVSGALFLLRDNIKKIVYFREGHPIYVKSNLLSECLGNVLVREKMISPEECEASLDRMRETRRQQGTVLIEMGSISPQNLVFGLELQLQTKLFDIFGWPSAEYLFKSDAKLPSEVVRLELSNAALIAEGVRRMWDQERLEQALAPSLERYLVPAGDPELRFQHLPLDEMEQTFLDTIDGAFTLREHVANSPIPDRLALALAYVLVVTGVVELADQPTRKREAAQQQASEEVRVRQRLGQELVSLRQRDAFGVLGVAAGCSDEEVEQGYSRLARRHHPDRYRHFSSETRQMAREIFGLLYDAYTQIDSEDKRRFYRQGAMAADLEDISEVGRRSLVAEELAGRAMQLMEAQDWSAAHELLLEAVQQLGEAGDLQAMLGWVTYNLDRQNTARRRESIRLLRRAIELDGRHDQAYLYLGHIYAAIGRTILAEKQYERAVQCNPACTEALEQLQLTKAARKRRRTGPATALLKITNNDGE